jgi:hypothetical protein
MDSKADAGDVPATKKEPKMSMASKLSIKLGNIFSNENKRLASSSASQAANLSSNIEAMQEKARKEETLKVTRTSRIGFPYRPTCIAYDLVQHVVAIGTRYGYVKLYGGESVEYTLCHVQSSPSSSSKSGGGSSGTPTLSSSPVLGHLSASTNAASAGCLFNSDAVLFMSFVINEGALITYCEDGTLSFWNLRQKQPGVLFNKKLINEK